MSKIKKNIRYIVFIARTEKIKELNDILNISEHNLISLVGRRGSGKTRLLKEFQIHNQSNNSISFFDFEGQQKTSEFQNVVRFKKNINQKSQKYFGYDFFNEKKRNDWISFFLDFYDVLEKINSNPENNGQILVFVIDEFAWLNTKKSNFINEFGTFWNKIKTSLSNIFVKFYVASSAISWVNENLIKNKGSLYHKVDKHIFLKQFSLKETSLYFQLKGFDLSNEMVFRYYLITGGVVRYLQKVNQNLSFEENAVNIFTNRSNIEGLEFTELFSQTFNSVKNNIHKKIIESFKNKNQVTAKELIKDLGFNQSSVSKALNDLVLSDILEERKNFEKNKSESFYFLKDLFCLTYVKLLYGQNTISEDLFSNQKYSVHMGTFFENACYLNIDLIKDYLKKSGFKSTQESYKGNGVQIDWIIHYENSFNYSLVECKFYNQEYRIDRQMQAKMINRKEILTELIKNKKIIPRRYIDKININFVFVSFYRNHIDHNNKIFGFVCENVSIDEIMSHGSSS